MTSFYLVQDKAYSILSVCFHTGIADIDVGFRFPELEFGFSTNPTESNNKASEENATEDTQEAEQVSKVTEELNEITNVTVAKEEEPKEAVEETGRATEVSSVAEETNPASEVAITPSTEVSKVTEEVNTVTEHPNENSEEAGKEVPPNADTAVEGDNEVTKEASRVIEELRKIVEGTNNKVPEPNQVPSEVDRITKEVQPNDLTKHTQCNSLLKRQAKDDRPLTVSSCVNGRAVSSMDQTQATCSYVMCSNGLTVVDPKLTTDSVAIEQEKNDVVKCADDLIKQTNSSNSKDIAAKSVLFTSKEKDSSEKDDSESMNALTNSSQKHSNHVTSSSSLSNLYHCSNTCDKDTLCGEDKHIRRTQRDQKQSLNANKTQCTPCKKLEEVGCDHQEPGNRKDLSTGDKTRSAECKMSDCNYESQGDHKRTPNGVCKNLVDGAQVADGSGDASKHHSLSSAHDGVEFVEKSSDVKFPFISVDQEPSDCRCSGDRSPSDATQGVVDDAEDGNVGKDWVENPSDSSQSVLSAGKSEVTCIESPSDADLLEEKAPYDPPDVEPLVTFDDEPDLTTFIGPSPCIILQTLTMSNANDFFNLERLETIGDSFLKFAITVYLYCNYPGIHEGKLSYLRSKQVSNYNLYKLGKKKQLPDCMVAAKFEPTENWLPPGYKIKKEGAFRGLGIHIASKRSAETPERSVTSQQKASISKEDQFNRELEACTQMDDEKPDPEASFQCLIPYNLQTQHSLPDKSIADCVEALIGCYLTVCGQRAALQFMSWIGLKVLLDEVPAIAEKSENKDQEIHALAHKTQDSEPAVSSSESSTLCSSTSTDPAGRQSEVCSSVSSSMPVTTEYLSASSVIDPQTSTSSAASSSSTASTTSSRTTSLTSSTSTASSTPSSTTASFTSSSSTGSSTPSVATLSSASSSGTISSPSSSNIVASTLSSSTLCSTPSSRSLCFGMLHPPPSPLLDHVPKVSTLVIDCVKSIQSCY